MAGTTWGQLIKDAGETGRTFEPLPEGDYELKVIEAKAGKTGNKKTMYMITAQVTAGQHANRRIWDNLVVSPESTQAMGFFFRKMGALGLPMSYFESEPSDEAIVEALKGREFRAQIGRETRQGQLRNMIVKYFPSANGTGPAPVGASAPGRAAPPMPPSAPSAPAAQQASPPAPSGGSPWEAQSSGTSAPPPPPPF